MPGQTFTLAAAGVEAVVDLEIGNLASFVVERGGRRLSPFHRAPWAGEAAPGQPMPPHLRRLSVDFFCAPFGASDVEAAPPHGWPANAPWSVESASVFPGGATATFRLSRSVLSAGVVKTLTVRDGHPFLYQSHRFEGGTGALPVAYHAMVDLPNGGTLSFSPKLRAETFAALETDPRLGRTVLAYPARSADLHAFPDDLGGTIDLCRYPLAERHVELVMLIEDPRNDLGWAIAARPQERDLAIVLKSPSVLPATMLWYSNGGRFYEPWNARHVGVLGIEEARTFFGEGHAASAAPNHLSAMGIPTAFDIASGTDIRSVIGALEQPDDPSFAAVFAADGEIVLEDASGHRVRSAFDSGFLASG